MTMRRGFALVAASVAALAGLVAGGAWLRLEGFFVAKQTPAELHRMLVPAMRVVRPDGSGPFATVLLFHGCGGLWAGDRRRPVMDDYAGIALETGVAAIVVDSLKPRGIGFEQALDEVCAGWRLRGAERAGDVVAVLAAVRDLPWVDADRLALAGWSHGGWAVMDALAMDPAGSPPDNLTEWPEQPFAGLTGVFLAYPYCGFPALTRRRGWVQNVATEAILVRSDGLADPAACDTAFAKARETGSQVDVTWFDGVTHGFDERDTGGRLRFDEQAAGRAHEHFRAFLRRHLASGAEPSPAGEARARR